MLQIIDNYICELLYDHDCVIIPGLGGFIANFEPARIIRKQHTIMPPSKKIAFNGKLKNNDGLLADFGCLFQIDNSNLRH